MANGKEVVEWLKEWLEAKYGLEAELGISTSALRQVIKSLLEMNVSGYQNCEGDSSCLVAKAYGETPASCYYNRHGKCVNEGEGGL